MPNTHHHTRICLIRHGETLWNTERRIQGHTNIGLNPLGLEQAQAAARWLAHHHPEIQHIYSSDLDRAAHTAQAIAHALQVSVTTTASLRERSYGAFEGLTYAEAEARFPAAYHAFEAREPDTRIPNGESLQDLFSRIQAYLQTVVAQHPGEAIAIVCHGGVLDIVNRLVRGKPLHEKRDFLVPNAGLNWIAHQAGQPAPWVLLEWAITRHLEDSALDELPG